MVSVQRFWPGNKAKSLVIFALSGARRVDDQELKSGAKRMEVFSR